MCDVSYVVCLCVCAWFALGQASVIIVLLYIPAALMFLPVDVPLYLSSGYMYGFYTGSLVCWIGYNVGSWFGFFAARFVFRDWFMERTKHNKYIRAISAAVENNSFVVVILLQIAPVLPFSMVCYFFGTSACPFPSYVAGTAIGVIPCVTFFVFVGSTMESLAEAANGTVSHTGAYWYFFWASSAVGVIAIIFIGWTAKKQLDDIVERERALSLEKERDLQQQQGEEEFSA